MVEHDEKNFENVFAEEFKKLDERIKIPEIPDAQSIFEKSETKKQNVVPFRRYSKYVAAAAAVVLICISAPTFSKAFSSRLPQEAAEAPNEMFDYLNSDSAEMEMEMAEPEAEVPEMHMRPTAEEKHVVTVTVDEALSRYFSDSASKTVNGSNNSSSVSQEEKFGIEEAKILEDTLNENRKVFITIEKEAVSVVLNDIPAVLEDDSEEEIIISKFRIEGKFEGSYVSGEYYIINLQKNITLEDYDAGNYLPVINDEENGDFIIPEENIYIPGEVKEGVITLIVEISIETGEYKIYASLI